MTSKMEKPENPAEAERKARLAAALRENLKRRKTQARARREEPVTKPPGETPEST